MSRLPHYCPVCAYHNWNLDGLVEMIWEYLDLLRIYTKPKVGPHLIAMQQNKSSALPQSHQLPLHATLECSSPLSVAGREGA